MGFVISCRLAGGQGSSKRGGGLGVLDPFRFGCFVVGNEADTSRLETVEVVAATVRSGRCRVHHDDGRAAMEALLARLTNIPTPAGPTPRELGLPATVTMLPIVDVRKGR